MPTDDADDGCKMDPEWFTERIADLQAAHSSDVTTAHWCAFGEDVLAILCLESTEVL
jgi:hypothetical protein